MNAANLQIEGLCLAIASINRLLVAKGVVSQDELDTAFQKAEATARGDNRFAEHLSPSNRDAVCFPSGYCRSPTTPGQKGLGHSQNWRSSSQEPKNRTMTNSRWPKALSATPTKGEFRNIPLW